MSPAVIVAAAIFVIASAAFIVIGTVYQWDLTAEGYGRWTRGVGAVTLLALVGAGAWTRIDEPLVAAGIMAAGVLIAVCYVVLHRKLVERLRAQLNDQR